MTQAMNSSGNVVSNLSFKNAMRKAWTCWLFLLVIPFLILLYAVWRLEGADTIRPDVASGGHGWFIAAMAYLLVAGPASFFGRSHIFKAYWSGQTVTPQKYLAGMLTIWLALEIGGIFSLVGCLVNHALLPCLLPALIAFMFYATLWPSGRAMTRRVGNLEDPQLYEEPR